MTLNVAWLLVDGLTPTRLALATSKGTMLKLKSFQTGFMNTTVLKRSPDLNPIERLWEVLEQEI